MSSVHGRIIPASTMAVWSDNDAVDVGILVFIFRVGTTVFHTDRLFSFVLSRLTLEVFNLFLVYVNAQPTFLELDLTLVSGLPVIR